MQGSRKVVKSVAASTEHTVVLLVNGEVYAWGEGEGGQLGHGDFEDVYAPKRVEGFDGINIVAIASGNSHTLAMAWEDNGDHPKGGAIAGVRPVIYGLGEASFGQIGHGSPEDLCFAEESKIMAFMDTDIFWKPPKPPP